MLAAIAVVQIALYFWVSRYVQPNLGERTECWRYACPHGHANWEVMDAAFYCQSCARRTSGDGVFDELHDGVTNEWVGTARSRSKDGSEV